MTTAGLLASWTLKHDHVQVFSRPLFLYFYCFIPSRQSGHLQGKKTDCHANTKQIFDFKNSLVAFAIRFVKQCPLWLIWLNLSTQWIPIHLTIHHQFFSFILVQIRSVQRKVFQYWSGFFLWFCKMCLVFTLMYIHLEYCSLP